MRHDIPHARPGQVIGLLGGSFDPAHAGHVHITKVALRRFGLDRVWWLVSPGNPLKARVPVGVLARPGQNLPARASRAARIFRAARIKGSASRTLAMAEAPAWCFVNAPLMDISSSAIRARGGWGAA